MTTFNLNLRRSIKNVNKPIYLIVRYNNYKLMYHTREYCIEKNWNTNRQSSKDELLNVKLTTIISESKRILRQYELDNNFQSPYPEVYTRLLDNIFNQSKVIKSNSLISFLSNYILNIDNTTTKQYKSLRTSLNAFKQAISFNCIDMDFYNEYKQYLMSKGLAKNTIGKYIKCLKTVLRIAVEEGHSTNMIYTNRRFIVDSEEVDSVYLNESELLCIYNLNLPQYLDNVRDMFLIGCYTGLRYSDLMRIEPQHIYEDEIEIVTKKTKKKVLVPFTHHIVKSIRDKYKGITSNSLPYAVCNQVFNRYIKELCSKCSMLNIRVSKTITRGGRRITTHIPKYKLISSHTARRSFASNLVLAGVPIHDIMRITGHSKEESFLKYVKITPRESIARVKELHRVA